MLYFRKRSHAKIFNLKEGYEQLRQIHALKILKPSQHPTSNGDEAGGGGGKTFYDPKAKGVQCFNCKGYDHFARDCKEPKADGGNNASGGGYYGGGYGGGSSTGKGKKGKGKGGKGKGGKGKGSIKTVFNLKQGDVANLQPRQQKQLLAAAEYTTALSHGLVQKDAKLTSDQKALFNSRANKRLGKDTVTVAQLEEDLNSILDVNKKKRQKHHSTDIEGEVYDLDDHN